MANVTCSVTRFVRLTWAAASCWAISYTMSSLVRVGEGERNEGTETGPRNDGPGVSSVDRSVGAIEGSRGA